MKKLSSLLLATVNLLYTLFVIWYFADKQTPNTLALPNPKVVTGYGYIEIIDKVTDVAVVSLNVIPYALATFFLFRVGISITNLKYWRTTFCTNALIVIIFMIMSGMSLFKVFPAGLVGGFIPAAALALLNCLIFLWLSSSSKPKSN